jgi:hypothetical protein
MARSGAMTPLEKAAEEYLQLRRELGNKLAEAGRVLPRLVAYLESVGLGNPND